MTKTGVLEQTVAEETQDNTLHLLREIHHQVKNNLQIVCSLLRIQARSLSTSESKAIFKRSEERIQSMALVYDMLYRGALLEGVPVGPYLSELAKTLVHGAAVGGTLARVECTIEPLLVTAKVATHLGLLVNEALSHRLRQSSPSGEASEMHVHLYRRDKMVLFEVQDNGPIIERSVGVSDVERQILEALVRQLEGSIQYPPSEGFFMQVTMPQQALGLDEARMPG
jgi:two-component sensor histidine kinase